MIRKAASIVAGISLTSLIAPGSCQADCYGAQFWYPSYAPHYVYSQPVAYVSQPCCGTVSGVSSGGLDAAAYGIQLAPGERLVSPPVALRTQAQATSSSDIIGRLQAIEDKVDEINDKIP